MSKTSCAAYDDANAGSSLSAGTQLFHASVIERGASIHAVLAEHFCELPSSAHGLIEYCLDR
jgi:hypothetical protein